MGLFDIFKRKVKKESFLICNKCKRASTIHGDNEVSYICPDCKQLIHLQNSNAKIVYIDRRACGLEREINVLLHDEVIGYFCVRQSSGGYSGLGLWYYILPKDISNPKIENYIEDYENFICIPNTWFSKEFELDICGSRRMSCGERIKHCVP